MVMAKSIYAIKYWDELKHYLVAIFCVPKKKNVLHETRKTACARLKSHWDYSVLISRSRKYFIKHNFLGWKYPLFLVKETIFMYFAWKKHEPFWLKI